MKQLLCLYFLLIIFSGCTEEIEVPYLDDDEEIARYIADDDLGKVFFTTENLIFEKPYTYQYDSTGYYVDIKDSIVREIDATYPLKIYGAGYADPVQDFGPPFGYSQDAEVDVFDRVYAHTIRVEGIDTTIVNVLIYRDYHRVGYFMKLGDDGQRFSGWILRGFNGGCSDNGSRMKIYRANNDVYSTDTSSYSHYNSVIYANSSSTADTLKLFSTKYGYLLINPDQTTNRVIERVSKGESLRAKFDYSNYGENFLGSYENSDSVILQNFSLEADTTYQLNIQTPTNTNKTWDFLYFQEFVKDINDTTLAPRFNSLKRRNWVVPIKYE